MRIALFTLESALSARAVLDFCEAQQHSIVLIGRSHPYRAQAGGMLGQMRAHWRRSGPRIMPFLIANYGLPYTLGTLRRALGRGPLTGFARRHGIPLHTTTDINGPATTQALREARPDLIVSLHFDQIFTADTLALAPQGGINVHPSLLPDHRGPIPTFWAMIERRPRFGVTVHRLAPRIDAGGILAQEAVPFPPRTSTSQAARLLHQRGAALAATVAQRIASGDTPAEAQPPILPYCPFPPATLLRQAAREGCRLLSWRDLPAALRAPTG